MSTFKKLTPSNRLITLFPAGIFGFFLCHAINQYLLSQGPSSTFYDYLFYAFNVLITVGICSYLFWFYRAYNNIYNAVQGANFLPSLAVVLCHVPILNWIPLPITMNELWNKSTHNASKPLSLKLFIYWWILSNCSIFTGFFLYQPQMGTAALVTFWQFSILISFIWVCHVTKHISVAQNTPYFQNLFSPAQEALD